MIASYIRMSLHSIRSTRARSLLTNLGIVIGVGLLVLMVNMATGIRSQSEEQAARFSDGLVSVHSGQLVDRNSQGEVVGHRLEQVLSPGVLTIKDVDNIDALESTERIAPIALLDANVESLGAMDADVDSLIGTSPHIIELLGTELAYGETFGAGQRERSAIIGKSIAENMFGEPSPIGRVIKLNGQDHIVRGVLGSMQMDPLNPGVDYNRSILIPIGSARLVLGEGKELSIKTIYIEPSGGSTSTKPDVLRAVGNNHQANDFTVLSLAELEQTVGNIYGVIITATTVVSAIALLIGGIGLMNIMLASVAERTREIGVRKAVGANRKHIFLQFLAESVVLSILGGVAGIVLAELFTLIIRSITPLSPGLNLPVILIVISMSLAVGLVFGAGPAWKAAKKQPMEALRS